MKQKSEHWTSTKFTLFLLTLMLLFLTNSCKKDKTISQDSSCPYRQAGWKPISKINFNKISMVEYDGSYILYYEKNSNFQNPIDTFYLLQKYIGYGSNISYYQGDTTGQYDYVRIDIYPNSFKIKYDWLIIFPKLSKEYKLSDFQFEVINCKTSTSGNPQPIEALKSYKVDSVLKTAYRIEIDR